MPSAFRRPMPELPRPRSGRGLVVDHDAELGRRLADLLATEGYLVDVVADGQRGLHLALSRGYDVIVAERTLPVLDGLELVSRLRRRGALARIMILSGQADPADRVAGLDAGADDYMAKPFDAAELLARVRALARRTLDQAEVILLGEAELDVPGQAVRLPCGEVVRLSRREFQLLQYLALRRSVVHDRARLREAVFPDTTAESVVDTYVYYLRRKLWPGVIRTVHGSGYQLGVS